MKAAMILAAGRGTRLRPFTDDKPKALFEVAGIPLIEHHIINLAQAGFERIVVNHAWLGGQIRNHLGSGSRWGVEICYSPEPPGGLETGGGIVQALPLFENHPFVTVNADIYTDFDFKSLPLDHCPYLHLILVNNNPALFHQGDFGLVHTTQLSNTPKDYTFAGIACYHPKLFLESKKGRYSITPLIRKYAELHKATASVHQGYWFDIGSIARLTAANNFAGLK